ncbi:hypothetical protein VTJ04DRAFT_5265 [Mycothermus thermophilus]|uniref:uncharacterized protein n=1 Tax=Humicola insolens TaxID=85995 RepID=UPI00374427E4
MTKNNAEKGGRKERRGAVLRRATPEDRCKKVSRQGVTDRHRGKCFRSMTDKTLVNPGAQSLAADVEDRRALRNHGTCRIGTDIRRRERRLAGLISRKGKGGLDRAMCAGDNAVLDHEPPYIVIGQKKPSRELPWTRQQLQLEAQ